MDHCEWLWNARLGTSHHVSGGYRRPQLDHFFDDHPTPFWVLIGVFLAMSPPLMLLFLGAFGLTSLLLNLPHLAIVLSVAITAYSAMSAGTLPSIGLPVIIGITLLTVTPKIAEMFDDLPPTLWGLFVKRR